MRKLDPFERRRAEGYADHLLRHMAGNPWQDTATMYVDKSHANSSDVDNSGHFRERPLKTLAKALALIDANNDNGTLIWLGSGHTETIAAVGAITIVRDNVTIRGVGRGVNRPTLTFATLTTATLLCSGKNGHIQNVAFTTSIDSLVKGLDITGDGWTIEDCYFFNVSAAQALRFIDATGDDCHLLNNRAEQSDAGSAEWANIGGARAEVIGNFLSGSYSVGCLLLAAACLDMKIERNYLWTTHANDIVITGNAAAEGFLVENFCKIAADVQTSWITTPGKIAQYRNLGVNDVAGEAGIETGTVSV